MALINFTCLKTLKVRVFQYNTIIGSLEATNEFGFSVLQEELNNIRDCTCQFYLNFIVINLLIQRNNGQLLRRVFSCDMTTSVGNVTTYVAKPNDVYKDGMLISPDPANPSSITIRWSDS